MYIPEPSFSDSSDILKSNRVNYIEISPCPQNQNWEQSLFATLKLAVRHMWRVANGLNNAVQMPNDDVTRIFGVG